MSKLEGIVPSLEDCKLIPHGAFPDSALVWTRDVGKSEFYVAIREDVEFCRLGMINAPPLFPAPTLAEILEKLPTERHGRFLVIFDVTNKGRGYQIGYTGLIDGELSTDVGSSYGDINPTTAALRLWMRVNGIEVNHD